MSQIPISKLQNETLRKEETNSLIFVENGNQKGTQTHLNPIPVQSYTKSIDSGKSLHAQTARDSPLQGLAAFRTLNTDSIRQNVREFRATKTLVSRGHELFAPKSENENEVFERMSLHEAVAQDLANPSFRRYMGSNGMKEVRSPNKDNFRSQNRTKSLSREPKVALRMNQASVLQTMASLKSRMQTIDNSIQLLSLNGGHKAIGSNSATREEPQELDLSKSLVGNIFRSSNPGAMATASQMMEQVSCFEAETFRNDRNEKGKAGKSIKKSMSSTQIREKVKASFDYNFPFIKKARESNIEFKATCFA